MRFIEVCSIIVALLFKQSYETGELLFHRLPCLGTPIPQLLHPIRELDQYLLHRSRRFDARKTDVESAESVGEAVVVDAQAV